MIDKPLVQSQLKPITLGAPGSEIGRKELRTIARRFQNIHLQRKRRIQRFLHPRQHIFLELLPLIFHSNYPALPGFISSTTPSGIPDYTPSRRTLTSAKQLSKGFAFKKRALKSYDVDALFLMGSAGSIGYSRKSDLDIWLCHRSELDSEQLDELKEKTVAVEEWASSLRLEVHFYLIDTEAFRRGQSSQISTDSCGSTQHYLLLEEFYRTGSYLAGKIPVWWLVPSNQEKSYSEYVDHLNKKRFINQSDVIDFGGLESIPPKEFIGAGLWHLYKAIGTPYKSLLKLLLMEAYASDYPDSDWLCVEQKHSIYQGNIDVNQLDPYVLMYRKVESYLQNRKEYDRLELARYCFYQKISELKSEFQLTTINTDTGSIAKMISGWERGAVNLPWIKDQENWHIHDALEENKIITQELIHSYRLLNSFSSKYIAEKNQDDRELKLLGRKLYSVLEKKPGKIEVLQTDSMIRIQDKALIINEIDLADGNQGWALYPAKSVDSTSSNKPPLRKSRSILDLLAWVKLNGFYDPTGTIRLTTRTSQVTQREIRSIQRALSSFLSQNQANSDDLEDYARPPECVATALFINVGIDPMSIREDGLQTASDRGDALSYGHMRTNLVCSIDQVVITSWHEVLILRYLDQAGLFDCFCEILNKFNQSAGAFGFDCFCFVSTRSQRIAARITEVFKNLRAEFVGHPADNSPRFILRGGQGFVIFSRIESALNYWNVADEVELYSELSSQRPCFSPVIFDCEALKTSPIPTIYRHNTANVVQIFCLEKGPEADIFILDERGALFSRRHEFVNFQFLLEPYRLFLQIAVQHYPMLSDIPIAYYSIQPESLEQFIINPIDYHPPFGDQWIDIRVSADELAVNQTAYTIYYDEKEYSTMEYGDQLFAEVAKSILKFRRGNAKYPIYLTDIDVPLKLLGVTLASQLQTIHLLQFRQKLETRLNEIIELR